jgi:drug/metabolite transporter (DMT)-like permease
VKGVARPSTLGASTGDHAVLLLLSAIWGGSFPLIRVAVHGLPPLWVAAGRIALGAAALLVLLAATGGRLPRGKRVWARLSFIGISGNLAPFALISWGEQTVPSGEAAILMAMVPLMVVLVAHMRVTDEPLTAGKLAGVALGILGTLVLIGPATLSGLGGHLAGEVAILAATVCYAAATVAARGLPPLPSASISAGVLLTAAPIGLSIAAIAAPPETLAPTLPALAAVAILGLLCTGFGYILYFRLIARAGAGFVSMNNYLVPPFGVLYGWMGLGERLQLPALLAMLLILAGVLVQSWRRKPA